MFVFFFGIILTGFGCGGIENSMTTTEFLQSAAVGFVGAAIMWVGTLGLIRAQD
jgi:hypothetical protein